MNNFFALTFVLMTIALIVFIVWQDQSQRGLSKFQTEVKPIEDDDHRSIVYGFRRSMVKTHCEERNTKDLIGAYGRFNHYLINQTEIKYCAASGLIDDEIVAMLTATPKQRTNFRIRQLSERRKFNFVFVRNPLERLAAVYRSEMVRNWKVAGLANKDVRDQILLKYRKLDPSELHEAKPPWPTETEFADFVIDAFGEKNATDLDPFWIRPMWTLCPFCSFSFDIFGRMETFKEDRRSILGRIYPNEQFDDIAPEPNNEPPQRRRFLSRLSERQIQSLANLYEKDFDMFGYSKPRLLNEQNVAGEKTVDLKSVYSERTSTIMDYCNKNNVTDKYEGPRSYFHYLIGKTEIYYCRMGKIASGSLTYTLSMLTGMPDFELATNEKKKQHLLANNIKGYRFNRTKIEGLKKFSFVFVRNPLSRLASAYYDKLVHNWNCGEGLPAYKPLRDEIISKYRNLSWQEVYEDASPPFPTEHEFADFVIDSFKNNSEIDLHWRPMWTLCPFCSHQYDAVGRMETFEADRDFILHQIAPPEENEKFGRAKEIHAHKSPVKDNSMERFVSQITKYQLKALIKFYQRDFEMFGYAKPDVK